MIRLVKHCLEYTIPIATYEIFRLTRDTDRRIIILYIVMPTIQHAPKMKMTIDNTAAETDSGHPLANNTKHDHDDIICNT